jgi:hypothetical protein
MYSSSSSSRLPYHDAILWGFRMTKWRKDKIPLVFIDIEYCNSQIRQLKKLIAGQASRL